jgi:hypothetical protein
MRPGGVLLIFRVFWELLRYDLLVAVHGFRGVHRRLGKIAECHCDGGREETVCRALDSVCTFYWKRVLCLQRAVVTVRMLRACGVPAELVIGCRPIPFFSHAWVEVNGRPIHGSAGFAQRLQVLERI